MSFEEPTQRIHVQPRDRAGYSADAPTTAMPGPLNLAGSAETDDTAGAGDTPTTDILSLDELFDGQPAPDPGPDVTTTAPAAAAPPAAEAPTWTAMPVVAVRSEPVTPARPAASPSAPAPAAVARPALGDRVRSDASAAWEETVRRTRAWLARDDNALMLLTALVAVVLIIAVTAFS